MRSCGVLSLVTFETELCCSGLFNFIILFSYKGSIACCFIIRCIQIFSIKYYIVRLNSSIFLFWDGNPHEVTERFLRTMVIGYSMNYTMLFGKDQVQVEDPDQVVCTALVVRSLG